MFQLEEDCLLSLRVNYVAITVVVILTERFNSFSCYIKYIIFQTHILREIHIDKTAQITQQMKKTGSYPIV